jgi:hypothetical protein
MGRVDSERRDHGRRRVQLHCTRCARDGRRGQYARHPRAYHAAWSSPGIGTRHMLHGLNLSLGHSRWRWTDGELRLGFMAHPGTAM